MLTPLGRRCGKLSDSWGQLGPQFPTESPTSGTAAPLEFEKPPGGGTGNTGMLDFLTWCSSALWFLFLKGWDHSVLKGDSTLH